MLDKEGTMMPDFDHRDGCGLDPKSFQDRRGDGDFHHQLWCEDLYRDRWIHNLRRNQLLFALGYPYGLLVLDVSVLAER